MIAFIVGEIVLRVATARLELPPSVTSVRQSLRWQEHPFLPYIGHRGLTYEAHFGEDRQLERFQLNSYGFRAHEFPEERVPEEYVVLAFGGSTTMGFHVADNDRTWPELLEAMLAERYPERPVRVFNLGLDMATTAVSVVNMALVGVRLRPDLVIVYQGYNDLAAMGFAEQRWDHSHFYRDLDVDSVLGAVERAHSPLARSYLWSALVGALNPATQIQDLAVWARRARREGDGDERMAGLEDTLDNLRTVRALAETHGGHALVSTFQFRDPGDPEGNAHRLNGAYRAMFAAEKFDWVDQDNLIPNGNSDLQVDECHFTDEGNDLLARNFFAAIVAKGWIE